MTGWFLDYRDPEGLPVRKWFRTERQAETEAQLLGLKWQWVIWPAPEPSKFNDYPREAGAA